MPSAGQVPVLALMLALFSLPPAAMAAEAGAAQAGAEPVKWQDWHADNSVKDLASLQRGASNFLNYCNGCHSLKYMRYQRMADDLKISTSVLETELLPPGAKNLDYITTSMPAADAVSWFGKVPPDLSLIARSRSPDYIYRFLKSFYLDPSTATRSNNLAYPMTAMPAVLSDLGGVNVAVFRSVGGEKVFDHFTTQVPGTLTAAQYDDFVRDTVNFLDYVGEPAQVARRAMGKWVVLFLLVLTSFAWMLKKEYWKDVH